MILWTSAGSDKMTHWIKYDPLDSARNASVKMRGLRPLCTEPIDVIGTDCRTTANWLSC